MTHNYPIEGMAGNDCRSQIEKILNSVEGVKKAHVDLEKEEVEIQMGLHIELEIFQKALKDAGGKYQITSPKPYNLYIKNMVCPRCISSVEASLTRLEIPFEKVSLGEVVLKNPLPESSEKSLQSELKKSGFELITHKHKRVANQIKTLIIDGIYKNEHFDGQKLSAFLSEKLHQDYSHLSNLFTKTEGKSIQDFQRDVKIMRIKELLEYDELSISEIATDLGYGNAAYLSTQFKKATGQTPSEYKLQVSKNRGSLDSL